MSSLWKGKHYGGRSFSMCWWYKNAKHDFLGTDIRSYSAYSNIFQQWNTYFETRLQRYVVCLYLAFTALFNRDQYTGSPVPETSALPPYTLLIHITQLFRNRNRQKFEGDNLMLSQHWDSTQPPHPLLNLCLCQLPFGLTKHRCYFAVSYKILCFM